MLSSVVRWALYALSFCVFAPAPVVFAQESTSADQPDIIETQPVVVSATKTEIPIKQVTSAVEVITEEDLKWRNIKTVADALRLSQGVTMFSNGGPGTSASVRIRGSNSDQVLVLIDGAIVNSATLGSYDFANLTTDNIERIEILRGNQSMLWGSDAMGGVINITTKRGTGKPNISGFAEYGSFNTIREGASASGKKGPIDFSGSISRWDTAGFSAINYRRGATERDGYHNWQGSARVGADLPKDGRLEFSFRWLSGIVNYDGFSGSSPADVLGAKSRDAQYIFAGNYTQPITTWWTQKLTLSRATESLISDGGTFERNLVTGATGPVGFFYKSQYNTTSNRIEWQHNVQLGKYLLLTGGYQFREQKGTNTDLLAQAAAFTDKVISSHAGFGEAQLNLWDRLFATAGVRQDEYNVFGSATTYRVTGGYLLKETDTKMRGSYATGFRAPTINQLYDPYSGDRNLKPERSQGLDIGIDQYFLDKRLMISGGYFWSRFRDMIIFSPTATACAGGSYCAENVGVVGVKGWEASVKYAVIRDMPLIKSLDVQAQYTNTMTRNLQDYPGKRAPRMPVDQWSMIISYQPIEEIRINLEGRYVGSRFDDTKNQDSMRAFDVWNLAASYAVTKQIQAYMRLDNIFNEKYEEVLYYGTPIRSIFGGVRMNYDIPL
jgi:vitamin B12 transporter